MQLKVKIGRQQAAKEQKLRRKNLTKYVPNAAAAVFKVLQTMSETPAVRATMHCCCLLACHVRECNCSGLRALEADSREGTGAVHSSSVA